jgi:hypothetical protein
MKDLTGKGKPFHSALDKAAGLLKRKVGTGAEFMQELKGLGGIKQAEIDERKLGEVMGMPRMTHDQFMANLAIRPVPAIQEKVLGNPTDKEIEDKARELAYEKFMDDWRYGEDSGLSRKEAEADARDYAEGHGGSREYLEKAADAFASSNQQPRHGQYTLPGGGNYREMLIKAPKEPNEDQFYGPRAHFGGENNILASMRLKDRIGPNGEKLLHLEELQSDWHQQGREEGYKEPNLEEKMKAMVAQYEQLSNQRRNLLNAAENTPDAQMDVFRKLMDQEKEVSSQLTDLHEKIDDARSAIGSGVPDAPFKKNWEEMALKRLIHHAAENGYHGIVVTPGEEQADRYSLAKQIGYLGYNPEEGHLQAFDHDRRQVFNEKKVPKEKVADYIGKEAADRLLQAPKVMGHHQLEGEDIKVGGEGMKGFYDKKVPNILNSIGKKYGVKTELNGHNLKVGDDLNFPEETSRRNNLPSFVAGETKPVHYFPITEDMRKDITTNGLPLYAEGGIIRKAEGGNVQPSLAQMKLALSSKVTPPNIKDVGINEAINLAPKVFMPPDQGEGGMPAPGGVATRSGMPIGGIDMSKLNPGQQLMPQGMPQQPPQGAQPPQGGLAPQGPTPPMGNMLQMTPQGQAMSAMGGGAPNTPPSQGLAKGGQPSVDAMKSELAAKKTKKAVAPVASDGDDEEEPPVTPKRITIKAEGPGGVTGIVVPHHMLHGRSWINKKGKKVVVPGLKEINKSRAAVYGAENRDPLTLGQMAKIHKDTLSGHFTKPLKDQLAAEKEATQRLRDAKHLGAKNNTLDESEKLDTVRHETDEQGRTHVGFASKGVAGHALYTSGHGENEKHHIINTCPGQTEGCGGGKDAKGVIDTSRGTCFAPGAESQYVHAAVRRACHEQAKHDPAMTRDWILAHTGSMREAAKKADKSNQRLLFRPNVVDETDVSSRHAIRHLNEQRKAEDKPPIIANSYGKTNELHDPENGYYVTHSNVGPKVKKGQEIAENVGRDKARVRNTIMAADNRGDFKNEQGNKTPPKGSYMVTDVKRGSPMAKKMEEHITHAKYWTTGRAEHELTEDEKAEGPEGHFNGSGRKTSEDKAHYGHTTVDGKRFDYQRQHILHPRLVNVPIRKKNKKTGEMETKDHMIPTDSRFKDTEFLPKNRFKTKNGKEAGHILMTTPTESTSNIGHETSFTHNVSQKHIEHAMKNNGEYEIDKPEDQIKASGKEYAAPKPVTIPKTWKLADGGSINLGRHHGYSDDDFHAFPERNVAAQRHLAMRRGEDEQQAKYHSPKQSVKVHKNMDTMRLELTRK